MVYLQVMDFILSERKNLPLQVLLVISIEIALLLVSALAGKEGRFISKSERCQPNSQALVDICSHLDNGICCQIANCHFRIAIWKALDVPKACDVTAICYIAYHEGTKGQRRRCLKHSLLGGSTDQKVTHGNQNAPPMHLCL